jgi:hypothetical protein
LPWPDAAKLKHWWSENRARFTPGVRHLLGTPLDARACEQTLESGFQSQRRIAAEHLCLLDPGTPWFDVVAPSWRQKQRLHRTDAPMRT